MNIAVIFSSFLSAMLGAMGVGGGAVLIIYLTSFLSFDQKTAQGIKMYQLQVQYYLYLK